MTSIQEFKCIFCKESFDNKEELQIHFRKHGDPNFNNQTNKGRVQSVVQVSNDSSKDESELVGCDVCAEVFPTISKAITHKHKVHPEHAAKYFCPWCGKLFTMKHLYNKHMQANHSDLSKNEENTFHCDSCNVDFHLPTAMIYHNKFFHRQDTDIPLFGLSKKLKMYNQEVISIYYCSFCGEEYENKVNLHKHSTDDHNDENQSPDVVLRCPLCDAIFYHLDAYELHLTFHTPDDLYSERSEMADDVSEYSLESVPPIMEKVESCESQGAESTMNAVGIEDFLEQVLEEPDGAVAKKNKKHKKHKKSKKSAITLDEFLNMNKDVFGEGLDFQGVEEVPTRAITKRLKVIKKTPTAASEITPELEKLRKHGIVIKKKPGQNISLPNKVLANNFLKPTQTIVSNKIHSEPIVSTSDDTIDKLINQSNSQIKIVKKSNKDNYFGSKTTSELNKLHDESNEMECDSTKKDIGEFPANDASLENVSGAFEDTEKESKVKEIALRSECHIPVENSDDTQYDDIDNTSSIDEKTEQVSRNETEILKSLANINTIKVESTSNSMVDNTETTNDIDSVPNKNDENLNNPINVEKQSKIDSLSSLKRLSHLITVKPVLSHKTTDSSLVKNVLSVNLPASAKDNVETPILHHTATKVNVSETDPKNNESTNNFPSNVSKNILMKCLSPQTKSEARNITIQGKEGNDFDNRSNKTTNFQTSNINIARNDNFKSSEFTQPKLVSVNTGKISNSPETNCNEKDKQDTTNLLKHLTGITAKPLNTTKCTNKNNASLPTRNIINKNVRQILPQKEIINSEEIEIYNIDDSDDDIDQDGQNNKSDVSNSTQPSDVLRNLSKNITVRSLSHSTSVKNETITQEAQKEKLSDDKRNLAIDQPQSSVGNDVYASDLPKRIADKSINEKDAALKNALKHLGKSVTVKPRNASSQSVPYRYPQDKNMVNYKCENNSNSLKTVKITEVTDEGCDDESENDHISDNVIVESPDDSRSDKEENVDTDMEEADFEDQINANMLRKDNNQVNSLQNEDRKQLQDNIAENDNSSESNLNLDIAKSLGNQISIKPVKQVRKEVKHENIDQICGQTSCSSLMNQKMSTSNQLNTVNKQVMVKTYQTQTKTVIQEITTTVTKTIKTVNQTLKQEVQNVNNYSSTSILPQKVQGMRVHQPSRNLQGIVVRQSSPPMRPKIRNASPAISAVGTTVRHSSPVIPVGTAVRASNQAVPIRPRSNVVRPCNPRMSSMPKIRPSTSTQTALRVSRPPRISSDAMVIPVKRPSMEDTSGPFSCFKKPKESLIPVSDISTLNNGDSESMTEYTSVCKSNSMSTSSTVKGNSVVTSSQMKSEVNTSSQQLIRSNNTSGIKVTKTSQSKQAQVQETSEISASQRTTLEAIQKLQKQGLLVKKPRLDIRQDSDGSDNSGNNSTDENDY